jgi:hypothetical protein
MSNIKILLLRSYVLVFVLSYAERVHGEQYYARGCIVICKIYVYTKIGEVFLALPYVF